MPRPIEDTAAEIRAMLHRRAAGRAHPADQAVLAAAAREAAQKLGVDSSGPTDTLLDRLRAAGLAV